jgi:hypothetical protein
VIYDDPKAKTIQHLGNALALLLSGNRSGAGGGRRVAPGSGRPAGYAGGGGGARINVPGHPCHCYGPRRR